MGLKLKDEVNPEILRNFGFRLGREYFGNEKCVEADVVMSIRQIGITNS